ncbi:MAG: cation:proton antiporter [Desulfosarcina sp.]
MIIDSLTIVQATSRVASTVLIVSMALAFIRLVRGPQSADRVVALDLISVLIVAFLAAYAVNTGETSFLDVAIAYALVAFLGTVALARFLSRSPRADRHRQTKGEG